MRLTCSVEQPTSSSPAPGYKQCFRLNFYLWLRWSVTLQLVIFRTLLIFFDFYKIWLLICQRESSSIILVGLPLRFGDELERISAYMEENIEMELTVEMTYSQAMFFKHFSKEIDVENYIPDSVEWYKEEGGIHIKGRTRLVKRGRFIKRFFCCVELSQS